MYMHVCEFVSGRGAEKKEGEREKKQLKLH